MATKIEFSNKELYHAFDIDLFSPEEFIESFQNESVFEPETSLSKSLVSSFDQILHGNKSWLQNFPI